MPHFIILLTLVLSPVHERVRAYKRAGAIDVAKVYSIASDEYREAIAAAVSVIDPDRKHPEWELELWRICKRESWCGAYGPVTVHERDGWAGKNAYTRSVRKGLLDPEECPDHSLENHLYSDFSTRGGFGQIFAYHGWRLGWCTAPEAFDDPKLAAYAALHAIATCAVYEDGRRRACTCQDHAISWVGPGRWAKWTHARRRVTLQRQCGPQPELTDEELREDEEVTWLRPARLGLLGWFSNFA
jgi:hypothetical protein